SEFSFTISLILGFAERSANEMTEIAGEMKNECAGGIGYARSGLPQRSIVRISGDLTIDSAQLTQNHCADGITDNKKVPGHDARKSRRARRRPIGTRLAGETPEVEEEAAVAVESRSRVVAEVAA